MKKATPIAALLALLSLLSLGGLTQASQAENPPTDTGTAAKADPIPVNPINPINPINPTSKVVATPTPKPPNAKVEADRILEPYPAKPTGEPPKGWKIVLLQNSKVENKTEIAPGKEIKISVEAYKLEPVPTDGEKILVIPDPFYNPLLKNAQEKTLGATVTLFSEETESLRKNLQAVIQSLENSLKEPEKSPEDKKDTPESPASKSSDKKKKS